MSDTDLMITKIGTAIGAILEAEDVVKLRLWDDPDEYSDIEKAQALAQLFHAADRLKSAVRPG